LWQLVQEDQVGFNGLQVEVAAVALAGKIIFLLHQVIPILLLLGIKVHQLLTQQIVAAKEEIRILLILAQCVDLVPVKVAQDLLDLVMVLGEADMQATGAA
jgi:hypothetical protein